MDSQVDGLIRQLKSVLCQWLIFADLLRQPFVHITPDKGATTKTVKHMYSIACSKLKKPPLKEVLILKN